MLKLIHSEVTFGHYDSQEVARRLSHLEVKGLYVNSLIYSLLRLADRP